MENDECASTSWTPMNHASKIVTPSLDCELVDGASDNEIISMMNAHLDYNQILMYEPNEDKTSFITN